MRRGLAVVLLAALIAPGMLPSARAHEVGDPYWVNAILDHFQTPDLEPGEQGPFSVTVTNPYPWNMSNIRLRFEVYRYREIDVDLAVNGTAWSGGPSFVDEFGVDHGLAIEPPIPPLVADGGNASVSFNVVTYPETRHGAFTSQGSYFVRSLMEFDLSNGVTTNRSVMMSLGHFTREQFETARRTCPSPTAYCEGGVNLTYLGRSQSEVPSLDHLDGILPDTPFSVTERLPTWPFVVVGGIMAASLVLAALFYAEENPGKYPRLARWWLSLKGRARGARPPRGK